jgi:mRNA-degrading endonuclease RelE of RelBE toxin-antitoxin system
MAYNPSSSILFITLGSKAQWSGGETEYNEQDSIISRLPIGTGRSLLRLRGEALTWLKENKDARWQGVIVSELKNNANLVMGRDFKGNDDRARYFPALRRFKGRFFKTLERDGQTSLYQSRHHAQFLCALYGLMTPIEPIQMYDCPLETDWPVFRMWTEDDALTNILLAYIKKNSVGRVFDLTATEIRRRLIFWPAIHHELKGNVLHCFDTAGAGDDSLIPFGEAMKDYLLRAPAEELMNIQPEVEIGGVVFREVAQPRPDMPREVELSIIRKAEDEIVGLKSHPVAAFDSVLHNEQPPQSQTLRESVAKYSVVATPADIQAVSDDWLFSMTSEFRKEVAPLDKKTQGRIMAAIAEICRNPQKPRGDTVKPLSGELAGKWRFRLGDYRLVYLPDMRKHTVHLLAIRPRGSVYDE